MARGKGIDKEKLYSLAKAGNDAQEIMKTLGISNKSSLKAALADVMMDKGEVLKIAGLTGRVAGKNRKMNKMGLQIPKSMIEHQFKPGDEFEIEVKADMIVLKKV
jgi:hypothetical protein